MKKWKLSRILEVLGIVLPSTCLVFSFLHILPMFWRTILFFAAIGLACYFALAWDHVRSKELIVERRTWTKKDWEENDTRVRKQHEEDSRYIGDYKWH